MADTFDLSTLLLAPELYEPKKKPVYANLEIDWDKQITKGLFRCVIFRGPGDFIDLVTGVNCSRTGSPTWNEGLSLDGSSYATLPYASDIDVSKISILARTTQFNWNTLGAIVNRNYDGSTVPFNLNYDTENNGTSGFGFHTGGTWYSTTRPQYFGAPEIRSDGLKHDISGTFDGQTGRYYQDSVEYGTFSYAGSLPTNGNPIDFGTYRSESSHFTGLIHHVFFWDRALSALEVRTVNADPYAILRPVGAGSYYYGRSASATFVLDEDGEWILPIRLAA